MSIKINIPTRLKDITLRQYKRYLRLEDSVEDQRFLNAKMIEIFCSVPLDKVMLLKVKDSTEISNIITDIFEEKPSLVKRFELNGVEYGFQPQLDELTLGEYIDLDTFIGDWENMERAMNVLYRPIIVKLKDKYNIDKYVVSNDEFLLDMPMDAVLSSIFFLWNLGLDLSKIMTGYLDKGETEALTKYLDSEKNGAGISQFIHSLREMLEDLKISLN
tara:strand:- start:2 stop:652 length:651 start_codon:yes stop_codon:yes gene_type:complete